MPGKFLIIEQVAHEDAGIFGPAVIESGFEPVVAKMHEGHIVPPDPKDFAGILVMGGPMNVDQAGRLPYLTDQIRLIEKAATLSIPVLGICLGSQLAATAMGARVYAGEKPEIGWYDVQLTNEAASDKLFEGFPGNPTVFQWHGQTFDIPAGAVRLAGSVLFPNQAFVAERCIWGLQFHIEVTDKHVNNWLSINKNEVEEAGIDAQAVIDDTPGNIANTLPLAEKLFGRFLAVCKAESS